MTNPTDTTSSNCYIGALIPMALLVGAASTSFILNDRYSVENMANNIQTFSSWQVVQTASINPTTRVFSQTAKKHNSDLSSHILKYPSRRVRVRIIRRTRFLEKNNQNSTVENASSVS